MGRARIKLDKNGIIALMHEQGVVNAIDQAAEVFAASAGSDFEAQPWMRRTKYVANVVDTRPNGLFREAVTGNLARTLSRLEK
ncbi:hypothetical protein M2118_000474 [Aurantimicrobium minutum]|uniref:hypothetical protein n=1 Tax=Aurantimicrobium minutum TaxID=708131 RepID=UPI00247477C8|nr:hypothetical protein [Aurantimicrobium minutum]MDH6277523.1 hypothetical protein [Aurantimicrobium minutum]